MPNMANIRYARTVVTSYMKNPYTQAQTAEFSMEIPESAFISNMSMIIRDKEYVAKVEEKSKARSKYLEAVEMGFGAGMGSLCFLYHICNLL